MNAKLCKRLRREALDLTVGLPVRRLIGGYRSIINDPRSARGVYRALKRAAKQRGVAP